MGGGRWAHLRLFRACATPALYLAANKLLLPVAGPGVRPGLRRIQTKSWIRGDHSELGGQKVAVENLWRDFFSNPSQWIDNRPEKVSDMDLAITVSLLLMQDWAPALFIASKIPCQYIFPLLRVLLAWSM
jgi:hypothetical protein